MRAVDLGDPSPELGVLFGAAGSKPFAQTQKGGVVDEPCFLRF